MAKKYDNDKGFLIIEMSFDEAILCNFGCELSENDHIIVCDNCNSKFDKNDNIYYFSVLNRAMCKECADDIIANQERYIEDIPYETKYYNYYAKKLNFIQNTTIADNYSSDTATLLDNMTDEELKEYFESLEADYWIDECKSNPDLMRF